MSCCCPHDRSASRIFSRVARRHRRRFERRGLEPSQRQLLAGVEQLGIQGASILEVGSGVGHLHQTLLERGASSAIGVDLAPRMLEEAQRWAAERGLAERTRYIEGDFVFLSEPIETADITLLDKVVCCYPDADVLIGRALEKTRRVVALTYPRDRWLVRVGIFLGGCAMRLIRSSFRPYLHHPVQIQDRILRAGFEKRYEGSTWIWLTQVFVCASSGATEDPRCE